MKPTIEILEKISENSRNNKEEIFTRLYRYLLRPDLYYLAYKNLYANKGAATKGVDDDTADGFSEEKISRIIASLADETYSPKPVRRVYIQKKQNSSKKRPLGIPTFTDKLVQEVLRMTLEAVYEPVFSHYSHGFRPGKSCHTALTSLKKEFTGVTWFIEGDIKGCFDNIDHHVLVDIINAKIKDARLIKLVWKFLKAGYMENWKYHTTYSGCPQGGIVSPILANIYLNELDKFAKKAADEFFQPRKKVYTVEYNRTAGLIAKTRKQLETAPGQEKPALLKLQKELRAELRKTPCASKTDKVMKYIRYADDFIIGVKGDKADCECIKRQFSEFISQILKMELSEAKTLITHSNQYARFLGYDIRVRRDDSAKPHGTHIQIAKGDKRREFARFMDYKNSDSFNDVIVDSAVQHVGTRTTFDDRLSARVCELCGKTDVPLEIHHVNKVKNLKGKDFWEKMMIAKKRKTLAVCKSCHYLIHNP